jgi:hypothetical protein
MFSKTRTTTDRSREAIPDTITGPASNGSPLNGRVPTQPATRPAHRAAVERDRRRHQRAIARERSVRERDAKADDTQKRGARTGDASIHGAGRRRTPRPSQKATGGAVTARTTRARQSGVRWTDRHRWPRGRRRSDPGRTRRSRLDRRLAGRDADPGPLGGPSALPTQAPTPKPAPTAAVHTSDRHSSLACSFTKCCQGVPKLGDDSPHTRAEDSRT